MVEYGIMVALIAVVSVLVVGALGIDVFSAFLHHGGSVQDLLTLEHGYAPPYAEALDPLHHLAAMVDARARGIEMVPPGELTGLAANRDVVWLDVREHEEAAGRPAPDDLCLAARYVQVPLGELSARCAELDRERTVIVICQRGLRLVIGDEGHGGGGIDLRRQPQGVERQHVGVADYAGGVGGLQFRRGQARGAGIGARGDIARPEKIEYRGCAIGVLTQ